MKHKIVQIKNKIGIEEPLLEYFGEYYKEFARNKDTIVYRKPTSNFFLITNMDNEVILAFKTRQIEIFD